MPTTGISLIREQTAEMRLSRFLWVPFELGRPFGAPGAPEFQGRVLRAALGLFERDGPPVLEDFPDDAPGSDDEVVWACPVSFASEPEGEDDLVAAVRAEMARLAPWAEQAPPPPTNGPLDLATAVADLAAVAGLRRDPSNGKEIGVEALRLAADDLRTWYLHAVAQQPGAATSAERMRWFWRETALGRLLGQLTARLLTDPDPMRRMLAERALVPRDHWGIVPDQPPTGDLDA